MFFGNFTVDGSYFLGVNRIMAVNECLVWLVVSAGIAFLTPNAYEVLGKGTRQIEEIQYSGRLGGFYLGLCILLGFVLLAISETRDVSEFLYFNF